ncbi:hypothetical protein [Paludisphaera borealis]|uniref:Uncharacterized protein n=1 Tax=Paludisphaera borealis TaxID=1387353 RepID=A0A1U7CNG3_9BACT|nr:hypothetical protein [Paludisphaera borealis]APW60461.1 hypothetical protein BSF38_01931 [Paludisphaera borealis]
MPVASINQDSAEHIGIGELIRRTGWGSNRAMRLALLGEIRTQIKPGRPVQFHAGDVERIAAEAK